MTIKERILQIAETKHITKQLFCEKIGLTYGGFTGDNKKRPINSDAIANILVIYPDVSAEWLITGKGDMLKSETPLTDAEQTRKEKELVDIISKQHDQIGSLIDLLKLNH